VMKAKQKAKKVKRTGSRVAGKVAQRKSAKHKLPKKEKKMDEKDRDRGRGHDDHKKEAAAVIHHHKKKEEAAAATPAPPAAETFPDLPPITPPVGPPPPSPRTWGQVVTSLQLKLKGVKRNGEHVSNEELKNIQSGADPTGPGDVVNFDLSPFDQAGQEIGPMGDQPYTDLDQLLKEATYGTYTSPDPPTTTGVAWPEGVSNHRVDYTLTRNGAASVNITGEYRNYGCGPNVKVEADTDEGDFTLQCYVNLADGRRIQSNTVGPIRTKWWGPQ